MGRQRRDFSARHEAITAKREAIAAGLGADEANRLEDATADANGAVIEQIETTPARTLAGLAFKVEISEGECHGRPELIESIMADIKVLAAGGTMREPAIFSRRAAAALPRRASFGLALPDETARRWWQAACARGDEIGGWTHRGGLPHWGMHFPDKR